MKILGEIVPHPDLIDVDAWPVEMVGFVDVVDCDELDENGRCDWGAVNFKYTSGTLGPGFSISRDVLEEGGVSVWDFTESSAFCVAIEPVEGEFVPVGGPRGLIKEQIYRAVKIRLVP